MKTIAIIGGHGRIGMLLARTLNSQGHRVISLFRTPDQTSDVTATGAEPVVFDIEQQSAAELTEAVRSADAIVFTAGAGGGSPERTKAVDHQGALKTVEAAQSAGVKTLVVVSSTGLDDPSLFDDPENPSAAVYQQAKQAADQAVMASDLDWTIVRPDWLTDEPATGRVTVGHNLPEGKSNRADVADILARLVTDHPMPRQELSIIGGDTPLAFKYT